VANLSLFKYLKATSCQWWNCVNWWKCTRCLGCNQTSSWSLQLVFFRLWQIKTFEQWLY